jgi:hypothetical protein
MRIYVILICSFLVAFTATQAADVAKPAVKNLAKSMPVVSKPIEAPISREAVLGFLNESNRIFLEGLKSGHPAPSITYCSAAGMMKNWLNFRFLEADTEIDKSWYERVYKMLDYLARTKDFLELAKMNGRTNTDEYKKVLANFNEVSKRFPELMEKPTPVEQKKLEKLRDEKRRWELTQKSRKSGSIKEE